LVLSRHGPRWLKSVMHLIGKRFFPGDIDVKIDALVNYYIDQSYNKSRINFKPSEV